MDPVVKKKVYFCEAQRIALFLLGFSFFRGQSLFGWRKNTSLT